MVAVGVAAGRAYVAADRRRPDPYRDEPYGYARGKPIGPVPSADGTPLHVEEIGAGPTVILSHGFSLNLTLWHHQITTLGDELRLVLYDQRGHGLSGRPPADDWSLEALARDLEAVVRAATDGERVVLVGHSMGGMAVLRSLQASGSEIGGRVAGIVLVDTTAADVMGGMLPGVARRVEAATQALQEVAMRALVGRADRLDLVRRSGTNIAYLGTRLMGFGPKPSPRQVAFVEEMLAQTPSDVWLKLIPGILGFDVADALPAMDLPTMVIVGGHDKLTPAGAARRIADAIPGAELVVVQDAGHSPMLERPAEFNAALRRFVGRVLG